MPSLARHHSPEAGNRRLVEPRSPFRSALVARPDSTVDPTEAGAFPARRKLANMSPDDVDLLLYIANTTMTFQQHIVDALTQYKQTGQLPNGGAAGFAGVASPRKRGKKPKLNKDGSEKQPRKPTAYNAWMQAKLKELKEAVGHDPDQKHVDTFKQAAHIWGEMPKEEKDRINTEFKERQNSMAAVAGNTAEADAALDAAGEDDDDDDDDDEEEAAPAVVAPAPESSSEDTSDEEDLPVPVPKPKPAPVPVPTPNTDGKKKKKRKQAADLSPLKVEASGAAANGDKQKKKKKKKDATA